jgi:antisense regulator of RalR protein
MAVRYKITATIMKPGNPPVFWTCYSGNKMTRTECENKFSIPKAPGRSFGDKAELNDFQCVMIEDEKV